MIKKIYRRAFSATWIGVLTIYMVSCIVPKKAPKKALIRAQELKPFDVIIVPGVPPNPDGTWDRIMKSRVLWSYILYKEGYTKNIIYSGGAVYTEYEEATVMGLYAQKLGIPKEHIFYDLEAKHSTENVYYSYLLAKKLGFKSIALATDPFQSFMLQGFTRKRFATNIHHMPFDVDSLKVYDNFNPVVDIASAIVKNFTSISQEESFFTRIKGTLGKSINWKKYPKGQVGPL